MRRIVLDEPTEKFLSSLKSLYKAAGVNRSKAAKALGIPYGTLRNYEKRICFPLLPVLMKMADYFGYDLSSSINYRKYQKSLVPLRKRRKSKKHAVLDEPTKAFLAKLRSLRKAYGMTVDELADELSVTYDTIINYENGVFIPTLQSLMDLADIFDYDLSDSINYRKYNHLSLAPRQEQPDGNALRTRLSHTRKFIALDAPTKAFLAKLRSLRKVAGLTIKELADQLGIYNSSLGLYERGIRFPRLPYLMKLVDFFGYDLSDSVNYRYYHLDSFSDIKVYCKRYGLSYEELAAMTGFSKGAISSSVSGRSTSSLSCLALIHEVVHDEHRRAKFRRC